MPLRNVPIRRKMMVIVLVTSAAALFVMCASFFTYEYVTFRQTAVRNLATLGEIIASNCTAALAFDNPEDARETLSALKAERHIVVSVLYSDATGGVFARYPAAAPDSAIPAKPQPAGYRITWSSLSSFQPVIHNGRQLGMLYLESDMSAMVERLSLYGAIACLAVGISLLAAFGLSHHLQQQISGPILDLAQTARAISERRDYSVRVTKHGRDEIGTLTDAFNHMLTQIHEQDRALRESEARLRAVLNSALSAVVVVDDRGRVIDWNARAEKMFGRVRAEALGLDFAAIVPPADRPTPATGMHRYEGATEGAMAHAPTEMTALRRDGDSFPVEVAVKPLVAGGTVTFCAFITDITERKRAEAEIQALNQQLERRVVERTQQLESANKELEAFSYSVSHDLRAPLRHINGFASMLSTHAASALDEKGQRYLNVITDSARRMGQLIDDLLSFSRHGRMELRRIPVKLVDMVDDVRRQMQGDCVGRAIEWRIAQLPEVQGDLAMLHQVFVNLIGNAVKYTRNRQQALIEIGTCDAPNGEAVIFIRDNGAGFNPKYTDRLFGVFQRLHSESEFEGTGVGLANVQRIVHRHGGRVWAEGEVDKGATFYVSLPLGAGSGASVI